MWPYSNPTVTESGSRSAGFEGVLYLFSLAVESVEGHVGLGLFVGPGADLAEVVGLQHGAYDLLYLLPRELQLAPLVQFADAAEDLDERRRLPQGRHAPGDGAELVGCEVFEEVEDVPRLRLSGLLCGAVFSPPRTVFLRLLCGEVRAGEFGDLLVREIDLELEVLVHGVHQAPALGLDHEVLELLEARVALVERAELHDHLLLDLAENPRLAAFL